jgi:hypothetical protein
MALVLDLASFFVRPRSGVAKRATRAFRRESDVRLPRGPRER